MLCWWEQADGDPMKPIIKKPSYRREETPLTKLAAVAPARDRDQNRRRRQDELLDVALEDSFPASDPISSMRFVSWRDETVAAKPVTMAADQPRR
jgi:hypothetical protein